MGFRSQSNDITSKVCMQRVAWRKPWRYFSRYLILLAIKIAQAKQQKAGS